MLKLIISAVAIFLSSAANCQEVPKICAAQWQSVNAVGSQIQKEMQSAASDAQKIGESASKENDACLKGTVRWEEIHWALDIPETTIRDQKLSFDVPEFKMTDRDFSYDFPETTCADRPPVSD